MAPDGTDKPLIAPWLKWGRTLQALTQSGLTFARNEYEVERYQAIAEIANEIMAAHTDVEIEVLREAFGMQKGYATPKVDVRGIVFNQAGQILLVQEKADEKWTPPGGWAEPGLTGGENVVKEVWEEANLKVTVERLAGVFDRDHHNFPPIEFAIYKLFYICTYQGGDPKGGTETLDAGFFSLDNLPPLSTGRVTQAQIECMAQYRNDNVRPTFWD